MEWKPHKIADFSLPLEERVRVLLASLAQNPQYQGFGTTCIQCVELISASQSTQSIRYALTVLPHLCNIAGSLHGGAAATLFDTLTSSALITIAKPGYWDTLAVSRTLTVTFLRPISLGTKVFLDCEVVAAGKRMAHLRGTMKTADGKVCATCTHDSTAVEMPKL